MANIANETEEAGRVRILTEHPELKTLESDVQNQAIANIRYLEINGAANNVHDLLSSGNLPTEVIKNLLFAPPDAKGYRRPYSNQELGNSLQILSQWSGLQSAQLKARIDQFQMMASTSTVAQLTERLNKGEISTAEYDTLLRIRAQAADVDAKTIATQYADRARKELTEQLIAKGQLRKGEEASEEQIAASLSDGTLGRIISKLTIDGKQPAADGSNLLSRVVQDQAVQVFKQLMEARTTAIQLIAASPEVRKRVNDVVTTLKGKNIDLVKAAGDGTLMDMINDMKGADGQPLLEPVAKAVYGAVQDMINQKRAGIETQQSELNLAMLRYFTNPDGSPNWGNIGKVANEAMGTFGNMTGGGHEGNSLATTAGNLLRGRSASLRGEGGPSPKSEQLMQALLDNNGKGGPAGNPEQLLQNLLGRNGEGSSSPAGLKTYVAKMISEAEKQVGGSPEGQKKLNEVKRVIGLES